MPCSLRCLRRLPAVVLLLVTCAAWGYPRPAPVPYRWELDFQPHALRLYVDPVDGRTYWYFHYTVTNKTGADQLWAPEMVLYTDAGEILASGDDVPERVVEQVISLLGNPLLERQYETIGNIFQGEEHARDGIVVWRAGRTDVNEMSLFISGISGETARVTNPLTGEEAILRKTLQRDYLIPGNAMARGSRPVDLVEERWVLR